MPGHCRPLVLATAGAQAPRSKVSVLIQVIEEMAGGVLKNPLWLMGSGLVQGVALSKTRALSNTAKPATLPMEDAPVANGMDALDPPVALARQPTRSEKKGDPCP